MFGKYSILDSLDNIAEKIGSPNQVCLIIIGDSKERDDNIFIINSTTVPDMQTALKSSQKFKQVYIYGPQSYKFLIFAVMYPIYAKKHPGSRYIYTTVLEKLAPKLNANLVMDHKELLNMELQLKILFS